MKEKEAQKKFREEIRQADSDRRWRLPPMTEEEALAVVPPVWSTNFSGGEVHVCVDRSTLGSPEEGWEVTCYYVHPSRLL